MVSVMVPASSDREPDVYLDARRLLCPLPILRAEAALAGRPVGTVLEVRATDPGIANDLPAWCAINGHRLLMLNRQGQEWIGRVIKGELPGAH